MAPVHGGQVQEGGQGIQLGPGAILGLGSAQVVTPFVINSLYPIVMYIIAYLESGAFLVTLASSHWALGHHDLHLPALDAAGHTVTSAVTSSTAASDNNMAGAQLVNVSVVRPGNWNHLQNNIINDLSLAIQ